MIAVILALLAVIAVISILANTSNSNSNAGIHSNNILYMLPDLTGNADWEYVINKEKIIITGKIETFNWKNLNV